MDPGGMKPHQRYKSADAAAFAWASDYNYASIKNNVEYGSSIYKITTKKGNTYYSYNEAKEGKPGAVEFNKKVPDGSKIVALIHAHDNEDNATDNDFSGGPTFQWTA